MFRYRLSAIVVSYKIKNVKEKHAVKSVGLNKVFHFHPGQMNTPFRRILIPVVKV